MARRAIYFSELSDATLNGEQGYRVKLSYGTFSIAARVTPSGRYWYAYKKHLGRLFKVYVGKQGTVTSERERQATIELLAKAYQATGQWYMRENRGRALEP